MSIQT